MDVSLSQAANAYADRMQAQVEGDESDDASGASGSGGASFASELKHTLDAAAATQNNAEKLQMDSVTGAAKVDMTQLVTAVANAELSLNTVVAIRDRVISAYQSIIGMAI